MRTFERTQFLAIGIDQAWEFISNPRNLARITPPSLDFRIVSEAPEHVYEGLIIEYRVRPLWGIPVKWVSVINNIQEPYMFTDQQLKGPYRYWKHTHTLKEAPGGVLMEDNIVYRPPFDWICPWINSEMVEPQLNQIFSYRSETLNNLFGMDLPPEGGSSF
jgi:ligand-binding SRPBCC domain-containing protein